MLLESVPLMGRRKACPLWPPPPDLGVGARMDGPVIMMSWHLRRPYCGASYVAVAAVLAACSCAAVWNF